MRLMLPKGSALLSTLIACFQMTQPRLRRCWRPPRPAGAITHAWACGEWQKSCFCSGSSHQGRFNVKIKDWMNSPVHTVKPRDTVAHARELLERYRINQLPVVRDG